MSGWQLLREGHIESGIAELREETNQNPRSASLAMELGVALLWTEAYPEAHDHFRKFEETIGKRMDIAYALAGTARWCDGEPDKAVGVWRDGLNCGYADAAGGVTIPLLLYFAAARGPELVAMEEAREWLRTRTKRSWIKNWPGEYAFYLLGHMSREQVSQANQKVARDKEDSRVRYGLKLEFWSGVKAEANGHHDDFLASMAQVSHLGWDDFDQNPLFFKDRIWGPEFFLARHEARQT